MKLAVIDCGTNTFNLVIARITGRDRYEKIFHTRVPVKLGEGTINGGYIDGEPFRRGIEAIRSFTGTIREEKVDRVLGLATSAIRDGSNGQEFVDTVYREFGIRLEVIDGDREAALVYQAVREAVQLGDHVSLIMDIGGGSTEFILANRSQIFWKQSFNIGAARLLAKFSPGDRISGDEIRQMNAYLGEQLRPLFTAAGRFPPRELVGSSGAFESFVEMIHGELGGEEFSHDRTSYNIDLEQYGRISDLVISSTMEERRKIKGLIPMRFDMIVICCVTVNFVLQRLGLGTLRMSVWSLKEGAMVDFARNYTESQTE